MYKKGFTIIELLVIFVVLGIIALIVFPIIRDIVLETERDAFKASADNMIEVIRLDNTKKDYSAEDYKIEKGVIKDSKNVIIHDEDNNKSNGVIKINIDGDIYLSVYNDDWCVSKNFADKKTEIKEYNGFGCGS